ETFSKLALMSKNGCGVFWLFLTTAYSDEVGEADSSSRNELSIPDGGGHQRR
ncbi:hypothetical protein PanWU01x14_250250, partial [Parasponia andersonii]